MEENKTMSIEEVLESEGKYVGLTRGVSMLPMIKSGKDVVVIAKKTERLKPYDVALYKRDDGAYVLHRVLKVVGKGYVIRGDNCYADEHVPEEKVIGVLESYFKGEKQIDLKSPRYLKYVKRRLKFYKPRRFFVLFGRKIKAVLRRIVKEKNA